ncbi:ABC transporter ATP-binding protein [Enterococcus faecalis]|nr:ABC transporter ATP-binding protein [Enterococcus faecalis]
MNSIREYITKLVFVFKEIFKAGPGVFLLSVSSMIITGISPVVTTYLTSKLIKELGKNLENPKTIEYTHLVYILLMILLLIVVAFAIEDIKTVIYSNVGLKVSHNIENIITEKFQTIKQERIDTPEFLDLHSNTLTKSGSEPLNLMEGLFGMIASLISVIGYAAIIINLSIYAFLGVMVFVFPIIIYKKKYQGMMFKFFTERTMQLRKIWYYLNLLTDPKYSKEVRQYRLSDLFKRKREKSFDDFMKDNNRIVLKEIISSIITSLISMLGAIFVGIWLIKNTVKGEYPISEFYLYFTAILTIVTQMIALSSQIASNSKSMLFINYIFEYMKEDNTLVDGKQEIEEKETHIICFNDVSFLYPGSDNYALKNINIEFSTDQTVCLVGENGSGKTTFLRLLLRIYDPTEGQILLDNIDIKKYRINELRKFFGVLFQDYIKYSDTVYNNIAFGKVENIKDEKSIVASAKLAGVDLFVGKFNLGYLTNLSRMFYEDGIEPSGGQWQKIAIARAIFSDASVVVLDEPTAALDPKSEVKMYETFKSISEMKSTIIISHRMYITKIADKVILLNNGKIVEEGSFEELIQLRKEFYSMYKIQADSYSL